MTGLAFIQSKNIFRYHDFRENPESRNSRETECKYTSCVKKEKKFNPVQFWGNENERGQQSCCLLFSLNSPFLAAQSYKNSMFKLKNHLIHSGLTRRLNSSIKYELLKLFPFPKDRCMWVNIPSYLDFSALRLKKSSQQLVFVQENTKPWRRRGSVDL